MRRTIEIGGIALFIALVAWQFVISPALDSPERRVAGFLASTSRGDEPAALGGWAVFTGGIHPQPLLLERRAALTHELAANHVGGRYAITSVEWWRTCCEPGPIADQSNAGLARVHVTTSGTGTQTYQLVFEVFVKKLAWWGDAGGETVRDWTLYEVHREGEPCVFPSTAYGCVRGTN